MSSHSSPTLAIASNGTAWRYFCIGAASLFLLNASDALAIDCGPLKPQPTSEELTKFEGEITGEIEGFMSKFVGGKGAAEGAYLHTYRSLIDEIPKEDRFKKIAWEKTLFMYCQIIAESNLEDEEKLDKIGELFQQAATAPPDVSSEIKRIPKLEKSTDIKLWEQETEIANVRSGDRITVSGRFKCGFWLGYKLEEKIPGAPDAHTAINVEADYVTGREDYITREFVVPEFPTEENITLVGEMTNGGHFNDWPCHGNIQIFSLSS